MDSFAQQMLYEIDRRIKLSNSSICLDYENNEKENSNENENFPEMQKEGAKVSVSVDLSYNYNCYVRTMFNIMFFN